MITRVADECFWLGRYVERVEATARALAALRTLALDAGAPPAPGWRSLLALTGEEAGFLARHGAAALEDGEQVERAMTWEEPNPSCILRSVGAARENARAARDLMTIEVWEALNGLHLWLQSPDSREEYELHRFGFYGRVRASTQLVLGQTQSTMLHDAALDFIWLGVFLERAGWTARLLDAHPGEIDAIAAAATTTTAPTPPAARADEPGAFAPWEALLRACSGLEPFLRRSRGCCDSRMVCAFLLLDTAFPRSVLYALKAARARLLALLPGDQAGEPAGGAVSLRALSALDDWLSGPAAALDAVTTERYHLHLQRIARGIDAACDDIAAKVLGPVRVSPPTAATVDG